MLFHDEFVYLRLTRYMLRALPDDPSALMLLTLLAQVLVVGSTMTAGRYHCLVREVSGSAEGSIRLWQRIFRIDLW
ncbi:hypothetical protein BRC86_04270 [Halobacteriales archaeon QS_3_64_16]|nr:MAG: hypothetical protein BRC86_04270 [Halobacteriales archaeon QS_3_64_16]